MRDLSRVLAAVGLAGSLLPTPAGAAPAGEVEPPVVPPGVEGPPVEGLRDAPPLESEPLPLDTDLDSDLDTDLDTDSDLDSDLDTDLDTDSDIGPAPDLDVDVEPSDDYLSVRDSPEAKTARRWLGAGIAATSIGAVLVGGGVAMGLSQPCDPNAGNNCFVDARNRGALTMAVPGGVLLLGGVAMTIVGALQKRRLFFAYASPSVAIGRDQIGLVVVGRF
jgi:hypothetical protein